ncbi:mocs2l, partial [Symbiodinium sp. CCMP2456]
MHNIHVRFWLGDVVIICIALYLTALLPATIMLAYKIYINAHRRSQKDHTKSMMGRGGMQDDFSWRISIRTLRFILMIITMLSTIAAVLGYIVVSAGLETSGSLLLECGKSSNGKSLEQMNEKLREFASSSQCSDSAPLDQCHGFAKAFPPPSPWATYTKAGKGLEVKFIQEGLSPDALPILIHIVLQGLVREPSFPLMRMTPTTGERKLTLEKLKVHEPDPRTLCAMKGRAYRGVQRVGLPHFEAYCLYRRAVTSSFTAGSLRSTQGVGGRATGRADFAKTLR